MAPCLTASLRPPALLPELQYRLLSERGDHAFPFLSFIRRNNALPGTAAPHSLAQPTHAAPQQWKRQARAIAASSEKGPGGARSMRPLTCGSPDGSCTRQFSSCTRANVAFVCASFAMSSLVVARLLVQYVELSLG